VSVLRPPFSVPSSGYIYIAGQPDRKKAITILLIYVKFSAVQSIKSLPA